MFKFKLDLMGRAVSSLLAILITACAVSLVTLGIRGVRPELKQAQSNPSDTASSVTLQSTTDYGQYYLDNMIFLCDGTLSHMRNEGALKEGETVKTLWTAVDGSLPLSSSIDRTEIVLPHSGEEVYIADATARLKPEYMLISLGSENGVRYCTEEQFKSYYAKIIIAVKEASPNTKIILNSLFPISRKYEFKNQGISMDKIDRANLWISEIAEEQGVKYLDSASALKGNGDYLDTKYDSGDGFHLNAEGYEVFFNYVRTHGYVGLPATEEETFTEETSETETTEKTTE